MIYAWQPAPLYLITTDMLRTCSCHGCTETVPVINACVGMIRSWMRVMSSVVVVAELVSVIRPIPRSELPWLPSVIFYSLFSAYLALCHAARRARNLYYTQLRSISASLTTVGITWPSPLREYGRPPQLPEALARTQTKDFPRAFGDFESCDSNAGRHRREAPFQRQQSASIGGQATLFDECESLPTLTTPVRYEHMPGHCRLRFLPPHRS